MLIIPPPKINCTLALLIWEDRQFMDIAYESKKHESTIPRKWASTSGNSSVICYLEEDQTVLVEWTSMYARKVKKYMIIWFFLISFLLSSVKKFYLGLSIILESIWFYYSTLIFCLKELLLLLLVLLNSDLRISLNEEIQEIFFYFIIN